MPTTYLVTAKRLSLGSWISGSLRTEHITHLQLDGHIEITRADAVRMVDQPTVYRLIVRNGAFTNPVIVESVHPIYNDAYVRTNANGLETDNLLSLPDF